MKICNNSMQIRLGNLCFCRVGVPIWRISTQVAMISTMLVPALKSDRSDEAHSKKLVVDLEAAEQVKNEAIEKVMADMLQALKEAVERANMEMGKITMDLKEQLERAKKMNDEKDVNMGELQSAYNDAIEKMATAEKEQDAAKDEAAKVIEKIVVVEKERDAAKEEAANAKMETSSVVGNFKDIDEFMDAVEACYDKAIYHTIRCFKSATAQNQELTFKDMAIWCAIDPFEDKLKVYHSKIPYSTAEIARHNKNQREKGLLEWVPPQPSHHNLRSVEDELFNSPEESEVVSHTCEDQKS